MMPNGKDVQGNREPGELTACESHISAGTESKSAPPRKGRKCKWMPGGGALNCPDLGKADGKDLQEAETRPHYEDGLKELIPLSMEEIKQCKARKGIQPGEMEETAEPSPYMCKRAVMADKSWS